MSKNCISITNIFCLSFILIYFLLPKSISFVVSGDFREFSNYLKPWYIQRYILVALMGGYTFLMVFLLKVRLSYNQYLFLMYELTSFASIFYWFYLLKYCSLILWRYNNYLCSARDDFFFLLG